MPISNLFDASHILDLQVCGFLLAGWAAAGAGRGGGGGQEPRGKDICGSLSSLQETLSWLQRAGLDVNIQVRITQA